VHDKLITAPLINKKGSKFTNLLPFLWKFEHKTTTMQKKEHYRHALPHYQQPGQAYFITWCLKSAMPRNKIENRKGSLWQKESFDVTIRNENHLYRTINYTLNNPVKAGLIKNWKD